MNKKEIKLQNSILTTIMFLFSGILLVTLLICMNYCKEDIIIFGIIFAVLFPKNLRFYE